MLDLVPSQQVDLTHITINDRWIVKSSYTHIKCHKNVTKEIDTSFFTSQERKIAEQLQNL